MKKNKGFTLIELLVVIAIIGILASVVLASLNSARSKGNDAAIKSNLANARAQAEMFYDSNNNSYNGGTAATNVCDTAASATGSVKGIYSNVLAAAKASLGSSATVAGGASTTTTAVCNAVGATGWAAAVPLKNATTGLGIYCVDSSGYSGEVAAGTIGAADVTCN